MNRKQTLTASLVLTSVGAVASVYNSNVNPVETIRGMF